MESTQTVDQRADAAEADPAAEGPANEAVADATPSESGEDRAALELRLQALVDQAQSARVELQEDARRRVNEAKAVLQQARAETEREREQRVVLEGELTAAAQKHTEIERKLAAATEHGNQLRAKLELTETELDQARAGLESAAAQHAGFDETRRELEAA